jgi:hypothetical protein
MKVRKTGQLDFYEPVRENNNGGWIGGAVVIFLIVAALAQCSG